MITARCYPEGSVKLVDPTDVSEAIKVKDQLVWVDVAAPDEGDLALVQEEFSLHALAMEDVRERHQRPKLEHYPDQRSWWRTPQSAKRSTSSSVPHG